ncbi:MAG: 3-dehydroquinate synthase, partial [Calditrichaeota bacterium]|nr:3-dehydroquinate synthase [Calditrichota bacterium]
CVKYGYIWDKPLLEYIKNNRDGVLAANLDVIEPMIHNCITIKRDIVEMDEKETGQRALLNFGHTFAHALETAANYEVIKHDEAVISCMICALYV